MRSSVLPVYHQSKTLRGRVATLTPAFRLLILRFGPTSLARSMGEAQAHRTETFQSKRSPSTLYTAR